MEHLGTHGWEGAQAENPDGEGTGGSDTIPGSGMGLTIGCSYRNFNQQKTRLSTKTSARLWDESRETGTWLGKELHPAREK